MRVLIVSIAKTPLGKIRKWLMDIPRICTWYRSCSSICSETPPSGFQPVFPADTFPGHLFVPVYQMWKLVLNRARNFRDAHVSPSIAHVSDISFSGFATAGKLSRHRCQPTWALHKLRDIISATRWLFLFYFVTSPRLVLSNNMKIPNVNLCLELAASVRGVLFKSFITFRWIQRT